MLFMRYAESLFFINDDQTELLELHIRLDEEMCTNDDINLTN